MSTGFRCPRCGSYENSWIPFSMNIECHCCGNVFDPEDESVENQNDDSYIDEDDDITDYSSMTRERAIDEYNRTGINHSEHDLNDWDDINRRLGFEFYKPKK